VALKTLKACQSTDGMGSPGKGPLNGCGCCCCCCRRTVPYGWSLADLLVFRAVRSALGFDRCRMCLTAAAPIMKDTLDFFMSLNLPLMEIYGMSETSGRFFFCRSFSWNFTNEL